jgi:hypothetical protein
MSSRRRIASASSSVAASSSRRSRLRRPRGLQPVPGRDVAAGHVLARLALLANDRQSGQGCQRGAQAGRGNAQLEEPVRALLVGIQRRAEHEPAVAVGHPRDVLRQSRDLLVWRFQGHRDRALHLAIASVGCEAAGCAGGRGKGGLGGVRLEGLDRGRRAPGRLALPLRWNHFDTAAAAPALVAAAVALDGAAAAAVRIVVAGAI